MSFLNLLMIKIGAKILAITVSLIAVFASLYSHPFPQKDIVYQAPLTKETATTTEPADFNLVEATSTKTVQKEKIIAVKKEEIPLVVPKVKEKIPPGEISPSLIPTGELNPVIRESLVNILCTSKSSGLLEPLSASGVIIDPRGVIITNAHVAEFFLLQDYHSPNFIECAIRTGSPAKPTYKASLLNISASWVNDTTPTIKQNERTGTGEHDYALLIVTSKINGEKIASGFNFPFVNYDLSFVPYLNQPIFLASYPAEFLGGAIIQKDLWPVTTEGMIKMSYYFNNASLKSPDLLGLGASVVAQSGSSGGAVIDRHSGKLTALIVTTSEGKTTGERSLNAVTINHISRSLKEEMGKNLDEFLAQDLSAELARFQNEDFPKLKAVLVRELDK